MSGERTQVAGRDPRVVRSYDAVDEADRELEAVRVLEEIGQTLGGRIARRVALDASDRSRCGRAQHCARPRVSSVISSPRLVPFGCTFTPRFAQRSAVAGSTRRSSRPDRRSSGTRKAVDASWLSTTQPAIAAPGATPTAMRPVVAQVRASVSRDGATCSSTRLVRRDQCRRDHDPGEEHADGQPDDCPTRRSAARTAGSAPGATVRQRLSGSRAAGKRAHGDAGEQAAGRPDREHDAGRPSLSFLGGEGHDDDLGRAEQHAETDRGEDDADRAATRTAVRAWSTCAPTPAAPSRAARRVPTSRASLPPRRRRVPQKSETWMVRNVTTTGPTTNTTSSRIASIENAVLSWVRSVTTWVHRARTMLPVCGVAAPASAAHTCTHGVAQSASIDDRVSAMPAGVQRADDEQDRSLSEPVGQSPLGRSERSGRQARTRRQRCRPGRRSRCAPTPPGRGPDRPSTAGIARSSR